MENKPEISFIIVNYKDNPYLNGCLASIFKNAATINKEIIIVNNCSKYSDTLENIKILEISENKGFGNACNIGAREAQGDILCFLNSDTEIVSSDFEKIVSEFNDNPKIGIIGPKLIGNDNIVQEWSAGREINLSDIILNNSGIKRSKKVWESKEKIKCDWVSGACMLIKKDLFNRLNGFDEKFFLYFEDVDLCKRAGDLNYKILYFPEFTIKHFGGKSFENKKEQKKYYYSSQDYYFQKHFGKMKPVILKLLRKVL